MNINQKRLKSSHIYTNSSKPINYSEKIILFSPSRKYKNALINLREGLNELENIDNIDNKKMNNKTINNQIGNTYMNNVNKLNFVNLKSEDHKKFMNVNKKKTALSHFQTKIDNSSSIYNNFNTIENSSYINNKSIPKSITNPNNLYLRTITNNNESKTRTSTNVKPQQNDIFKINNILKRKNELSQKKINELLKNIKAIQLENQKLMTDKNNLLKKVNFIGKELENKNNNTIQLKKEMMKLNLLLKKKKEEFDSLKNKIIYNKETDIKYLDDNLDDENNIIKENSNKNDLINQINTLKSQLQAYKIGIESKNSSLILLQSENQKKLNELNKKLNILQEENNNLKNSINENYSIKLKPLIAENSELKNKIKYFEQLNNNNKYNNINKEEFNNIKKDVEAKKLEIIKLNEKIVNLTNDLKKSKSYNDVLAKDIFTLRGEIDKLKKKDFTLEEENVSKKCIIEDLHKKNIELKNKLDLMISQQNKNINENNIINNVESLFSSKVKILENELKEMKDIYKQNLEKLNMKQNENDNESSQNKNTINIHNNIINNKSNSEQDDNSDKLRKDVQENRNKIEQLENEIMNAKDMELTRLIYTILENKGQNSQNEEDNTPISLDKKSNMYNTLSSQISDLLKINRFSIENQPNKINNRNEFF